MGIYLLIGFNFGIGVINAEHMRDQKFLVKLYCFLLSVMVWPYGLSMALGAIMEAFDE